MELKNYLMENPYPGRGIVLGKAEGKAVIAYFIMGRSENSRNRVFVEEADGVRTKAFDESKMQDPSLIIYYPYRRVGDVHIITNGDQTDTVYTYLKDGKTMTDALRTRTYEPDGPNFTPRISGLIEGDRAILSILKKDGEGTNRNFFEYDLQEGECRIIHTYQANEEPLPSFMGEPRRFALSGTIDEITSAIWTSLNNENKVSLLVKTIAADGTVETKIVNKNGGVA